MENKKQTKTKSTHIDKKSQEQQEPNNSSTKLKISTVKSQKNQSINFISFPLISKDKPQIKHNIIPFSNPYNKHNCFLNVTIQILFNTEEFRESLSTIPFKEEDANINPLFQLKYLFTKYKQEMTNETPKKLDADNFRKKLRKYFKGYEEGKRGDPVELINRILMCCHSYKTNAKLNEDSQKKCVPLCPAHSCFSIQPEEITICQCKAKTQLFYDMNCFIYELYSSILLKFLRNKEVIDNEGQLFNYYHKYSSEIERDECILKECTCDTPKNKKKISISQASTSLILNILWDYSNLKYTDVLKFYNLIPIKSSLNNLFYIDEKNDKLRKKKYYLYGIILFWNEHYTCAIKTHNTKQKWTFSDDDKFKEFYSLGELLKYCYTNYFCPAVLFYTSNSKFKETKDEMLSKNDLNELYNIALKRDKSNCSFIGSNSSIYDPLFASTKGYVDNGNWRCQNCQTTNIENNNFCGICHGNKKYTSYGNLRNSITFSKINVKNIKEKEIDLKYEIARRIIESDCTQQEIDLVPELKDEGQNFAVTKNIGLECVSNKNDDSQNWVCKCGNKNKNEYIKCSKCKSQKK